MAETITQRLMALLGGASAASETPPVSPEEESATGVAFGPEQFRQQAAKPPGVSQEWREAVGLTPTQRGLDRAIDRSEKAAGIPPGPERAHEAFYYAQPPTAWLVDDEQNVFALDENKQPMGPATPVGPVRHFRRRADAESEAFRRSRVGRALHKTWAGVNVIGDTPLPGTGLLGPNALTFKDIFTTVLWDLLEPADQTWLWSVLRNRVAEDPQTIYERILKQNEEQGPLSEAGKNTLDIWGEMQLEVAQKKVSAAAAEGIPRVGGYEELMPTIAGGFRPWTALFGMGGEEARQKIKQSAEEIPWQLQVLAGVTNPLNLVPFGAVTGPGKVAVQGGKLFTRPIAAQVSDAAMKAAQGKYLRNPTAKLMFGLGKPKTALRIFSPGPQGGLRIPAGGAARRREYGERRAVPQPEAERSLQSLQAALEDINDQIRPYRPRIKAGEILSDTESARFAELNEQAVSLQAEIKQAKAAARAELKHARALDPTAEAVAPTGPTPAYQAYLASGTRVQRLLTQSLRDKTKTIPKLDKAWSLDFKDDTDRALYLIGLERKQPAYLNDLMEWVRDEKIPGLDTDAQIQAAAKQLVENVQSKTRETYEGLPKNQTINIARQRAIAIPQEGVTTAAPTGLAGTLDIALKQEAYSIAKKYFRDQEGARPKAATVEALVDALMRGEPPQTHAERMVQMALETADRKNPNKYIPQEGVTTPTAPPTPAVAAVTEAPQAAAADTARIAADIAKKYEDATTRQSVNALKDLDKLDNAKLNTKAARSVLDDYNNVDEGDYAGITDDYNEARQGEWENFIGELRFIADDAYEALPDIGVPTGGGFEGIWSGYHSPTPAPVTAANVPVEVGVNTINDVLNSDFRVPFTLGKQELPTPSNLDEIDDQYRLITANDDQLKKSRQKLVDRYPNDIPPAGSDDLNRWNDIHDRLDKNEVRRIHLTNLNEAYKAQRDAMESADTAIRREAGMQAIIDAGNARIAAEEPKVRRKPGPKPKDKPQVDKAQEKRKVAQRQRQVPGQDGNAHEKMADNVIHQKTTEQGLELQARAEMKRQGKPPYELPVRVEEGKKPYAVYADEIINYSDREIVVVRLRSGKKQPFYKRPLDVPEDAMPGQWVPFDGIADDIQLGWFNKDAYEASYMEGTALFRYGKGPLGQEYKEIGLALKDAEGTFPAARNVINSSDVNEWIGVQQESAAQARARGNGPPGAQGRANINKIALPARTMGAGEPPKGPPRKKNTVGGEDPDTPPDGQSFEDNDYWEFLGHYGDDPNDAVQRALELKDIPEGTGYAWDEDTKQILEVFRTLGLDERLFRYALGFSREAIPAMRGLKKAFHPLAPYIKMARAIVDPIKRYANEVIDSYQAQSRYISAQSHLTNLRMQGILRMLHHVEPDKGAFKDAIKGKRVPSLERSYVGVTNTSNQAYIGTAFDYLHRPELYPTAPPGWKAFRQQWKKMTDDDLLHTEKSTGVNVEWVDGAYVRHQFVEDSGTVLRKFRVGAYGPTGRQTLPSQLQPRKIKTVEQLYSFASINHLHVDTDIISTLTKRFMVTAKLRGRTVFADGLSSKFAQSGRMRGGEQIGEGQVAFELDTGSNVKWRLPQDIKEEADSIQRAIDWDFDEKVLVRAIEEFRSVLLNLDVSVAGMRQGLLGFIADPVGAAQAYKSAWGSMASPEGDAMWLVSHIEDLVYAANMGLELRINPLEITTRAAGAAESMGASSMLAERIPGVYWVNRQQFQNYMPKLKLAVWTKNFNALTALRDSHVTLGASTGVVGKAAAIAQAAPDYVGAMVNSIPGLGTGIKKLGGLQGKTNDELARIAADATNNWLGGVERGTYEARMGSWRRLVLLTENWTRAQVGIIINAPKFSPKGILARRLLMQEIAVTMGITAMGNVITGEDVVLDPRRGDHGKITTPFGRVSISPHASLYRTVARIIGGLPEDEGRAYEQGEWQERLKAAYDWNENRLGQVPKAFIDLISREDWRDRPIENIPIHLARSTAAITIQNTLEAYEHGGPTEAAGAAALSFTGLDISPDTVTSALEELAWSLGPEVTNGIEYGVKRKDWTPAQHAAMKQHPEGLAILQARPTHLGEDDGQRKTRTNVEYHDDQIERDQALKESEFLDKPYRPKHWINHYFANIASKAAEMEKDNEISGYIFSPNEDDVEEMALHKYYLLMEKFKTTGVFDYEPWRKEVELFFASLRPSYEIEDGVPVRKDPKAFIMQNLHNWATPLGDIYLEDRATMQPYWDIELEFYERPENMHLKKIRDDFHKAMAKNPLSDDSLMLKGDAERIDAAAAIDAARMDMRFDNPKVDALLFFWGYTSTLAGGEGSAAENRFKKAWADFQGGKGRYEEVGVGGYERRVGSVKRLKDVLDK